jgi:hypothetical protein
MTRIGDRAESLQNWQGKSGSLAGAGLRSAEQIAPGKNDGYGLRLDGGGFGVTLLGDSAEQFGRQAEILERGTDNDLLISACEGRALRTGSGRCITLRDSGSLRGTAKRP